VHALGEIARVLMPGGRMVEFRPVGPGWPLEVVAGDRIRHAGLAKRKPDIRGDAACETALDEAIRRGWLRFERATTFEFAETWRSLDEVQGPVVLSDAVTSKARQLLASGGPAARMRLRFQ